LLQFSDASNDFMANYKNLTGLFPEGINPDVLHVANTYIFSRIGITERENKSKTILICDYFYVIIVMTSSSLISRISEAKSTWPVASFLKISINFIKDSVSIKVHLLVHYTISSRFATASAIRSLPDVFFDTLNGFTSIRNNLIEN
jgi:hypothetical protein